MNGGMTLPAGSRATHALRGGVRFHSQCARTISASRHAHPLLSVWLAGALLGLLPTAFAQESDGRARETQRALVISQQVYNRLAEAAECYENEEWDCALRILDRLRDMRGLTPFEAANMWNYYAAVYMSQERYEEAITAYESLLGQSELTPGLVSGAAQSLTGLYMQDERYEEALEMVDRWIELTEAPHPEVFVRKGQIYNQLGRLHDAIETTEHALALSAQRDIEPQESWYELLNYFYFEVDDYANSIRVLHILVEGWPKKDHLLRLAAMYSQTGEDDRALALYEAAHEAGWLTSSSELVTLARMLLYVGIPYKAGRILEKGLDDGSVEPTLEHWRLLVSAWQLAYEHDKALPALRHAAELSDDGEFDHLLAQSYQELWRWEECAAAARTALDKGTRRTGLTNLMLGTCLAELKRFDEALQALRAAANDESTFGSAQDWIEHVRRQREEHLKNEEMLRLHPAGD